MGVYNTMKDQRLTFNDDLINYEKWRTNYCDELFSDIIAYSGIGAGKLAVDVGCGTGKSTRPILEAGCRVIGIEYGRDMAEYVRERFKSYDEFSVENAKFEDFVCEDNSIDLLLSGTAFHWIPEDIGYGKAFRIIRPGGTLALFWSFPTPDISRPQLMERMQSVYSRYNPNERLTAGDKSYGQRTPIAETIVKYGFAEPEHHLLRRKITYNADDYISALRTFATHLMIRPDDLRERYELEIKDAINSTGGYLDVYDVMDLFLARKP